MGRNGSGGNAGEDGERKRFGRSGDAGRDGGKTGKENGSRPGRVDDKKEQATRLTFRLQTSRRDEKFDPDDLRRKQQRRPRDGRANEADTARNKQTTREELEIE